LVIFFVCLIASWFEIGNGKKNYFQYRLNIHILNQFSTTLKKDFEKEILICWNCDTLVCFCPSWKVMLINKYIYKHVQFKKNLNIQTLIFFSIPYFVQNKQPMCGGHSKIWGYLFNYQVIISPFIFQMDPP
jgi:hypothetical protein